MIRNLWLLSCAALAFSLSAAGLAYPPTGSLVASSMEFAGPDDRTAALAVAHFNERITQLRGGNAAPSTCKIRVGHLEQEIGVKEHFTPERIAELTRDLKPWQRNQAFAIAGNSDGDAIVAGGFSEPGTVYAVSELEIRLRVRANGEVYLDFPEWQEAGRRELFDYPAVEERGEYMNIGYNIPGITPHEWDEARWQAYIDKLLLAKLNRFYFYLWTDTYSMNPASALAERPLNKSIHENLRRMIAYARGRGLEVIYMCSPTLFPKDVWDAHPEIHADIVYVEHGFPAICPNAPGAWDLMLENARSEMAWFAEVDAIQIWFYDPGGCWCEKNGCAAGQAQSIARQFEAIGALFRTFNRDAKLEYNLWPVWVWEDVRKIQYRDAINTAIREKFPSDVDEITAVGGDNSTVSFPLREKALGFRSSAFLFGTNPESGYAFLLPGLRWTSTLVKEAKAAELNGAFGHRLEAWTRYPATFFMAQCLWDPDRAPMDAVRRWASWQCARPEPAEQLARTVELLEIYTDEAPTPELGRQMEELIRELWPALPDAARQDLEYFPAMFGGLRIIGESIAVEDPTRLAELEGEFTRALGQSPTFASLEAQGASIFKRYRELLKPGWKNAPF